MNNDLERTARSLLDGTLAPEALERIIESDPCWTEKNSGSPISAETLTELVGESYENRRLCPSLSRSSHPTAPQAVRISTSIF